MKLQTKLELSLATTLLLSTSVFGDTASDIEMLKKEIAELKEQSQTLIDETSDLKTGFNYTKVDSTQSHSGMGAAASKVYYSKSPLSIGGYGEMLYSYTSVNGAANKSKVDVYRFVPYIGYKFTDNIILNTEIEFEHGGVAANSDGTASGGEVIVEFMYLDFLQNENFNIRVGSMLVPMGLINERHEPTLFTTVQRPNTSKYLIPSTWAESGAMAYGQITEGLSYKAGVFTALTPDNDGDKWIRGGRGGTFTNNNPKMAGVARVDYTGVNGLLVGAGVYNDSTITMIDAHLDYNLDSLRVYGVYTQTDRSGATAGQVKSAKGGFINVGYDLLSFTSSKNKMPLFVQLESVDPQNKIAGTTSGESIDVTTVGVNYFPHEQVVLKADYAMGSRTGTNDENTFSVSMGFIF